MDNIVEQQFHFDHSEKEDDYGDDKRDDDDDDESDDVCAFEDCFCQSFF